MRIGDRNKGSDRGGAGLRPRWLLALVTLAVVAVVAAGCGGNNNSGGSNSGGGGGGSGYGGGGAPTTGAQTSATVSTSNTNLGKILVDGSGRTLYLFEKDTPDQSNCSGACVSAWPVNQSAGTPKAANGAQGSMIGTIKRSDGTMQVTYNKHPLYYYSGDTAPGQQSGQNLNAFGAKWFVVAPGGNAVT